ncbi:MAG: hypothetical protein M1828_000241 [Chrysothrix sp. TS-e1954]|nr:MAG: hypothetical protein M1828_000241 [Chrysothrix sp. TS-e1954]
MQALDLEMYAGLFAKSSGKGYYSRISKWTPIKCALFRTQSRLMHFNHYVVAPKELNEAMQVDQDGDRPVVPLCASWFLPNDPDKRSGYATYKHERIPGARFFDLDAVKDSKSQLPHMTPSASEFATAMSILGIINDDCVVVYDTKELGIFSAPRVAWMLKVLGHEKVHVLNNFRLWVEQELPTESGEPQQIATTQYNPATANRPTEIVDFDKVRSVIEAKRKDEDSITVIDARPSGRWHGTHPEPRPGLPSGHMPGSINVPFMDVLDPTTKALLPSNELIGIFNSHGVDPSMAVISSCGTGVSAAVIDLALAEAGHASERRIYDGSWTEWAQRVSEKDSLIERTVA